MTSRTQQHRTSTPNGAPANNSLAPGELYVEMADPAKIWVGVPTALAAAGIKQLVGSQPRVTIADTPPISPAPVPGDLWWNSTSGNLYIFYTDPTPNSFWVAASNITAGSYLSLSGGVLTGALTVQNQGVLVGNAGSPPGQGALTLNANAAAPPAGPLANPPMQIAVADGVNTRLTIDAFGAPIGIVMRRSDGTNASKAAIAGSENLSTIAGDGYDGTGYSSGAAAVFFGATAAWSPTSHPSQIYFNATPPNSVSPATIATFRNDTGCQHLGTQTNDTAAAGWVGESIFAQRLQGSGIALPNGSPVNITQITLTAGDWDVTGNVAGTSSATSYANIAVALSTTSASFPDGSLTAIMGPSGAACGAIAPTQRFSVAGSTTIYLVCQVNYSGGSGQTGSGTILARRRR